MNKVYKDPKIKISKEDFEKPEGFDDSKVDCNENYSLDVSTDDEEENTEDPSSTEDAVIPEELEL
jgi:hypothetical protein